MKADIWSLGVVLY